MHRRVNAVGVLAFVVAIGLMPITSVFAQSSGRGGRGLFGLNPAARAQIAALGDTPISTLPIPVLLGVEVTNLTKNFGDPRSGGRTHEGLDIMSPLGTPVASPTDAVVTSSGNGASSGLYVRTANPGGETFVYMHLSTFAAGVARGTILKRGDVLGFVGNTGNAAGGPTHLHFEIRKNGATDPYPRLTLVFTLIERMQSVAQALERGDAAVAATLVSHFRSTFESAKAQGIAPPQSILTLLAAGVLVTPAPQAPLMNGPPVFGETNRDIVGLQTFLIATNSGSASVHLRNSGATGYFGPITKAALIEYQRASGLNPTGTVDAETQAYIALSHEGDSSETDPDVATSTMSFTRDLERGMKGDDVRTLQIFLNTHGSPVAMSGDGSSGYETTFFGPATQAALIAFQKAHAITPAAGYFGPKTRAAISLM